MVLALCSSSLHIVRGAPTSIAGSSVGNALLPKGSALRQRCRRAIRPVPQSKTGIDQVLGHGAAVSMFRPRALPAPAWSPISPLEPVSSPSVRSVHCAAGAVVASSGQRLANHPFVRTRGGPGQISGRSCCAESQGAGRRVGRPPHNKSLLRSGGRWYLVCKSLAVFDKVPMINLGEPPAAELSRYTALIARR